MSSSVSKSIWQDVIVIKLFMIKMLDIQRGSGQKAPDKLIDKNIE